MKAWLTLKSVTFSLSFLYCMLAIIIVNICLVGDAYSQVPQLKVYNPAQSYEKGIQAQRQREEIRRMQLENQRLQQEMRERELLRQNQMFQQEMQERELQRSNRILEEKRQNRLLEMERQQKEEKKDLYTELMKLDELKQKGIITEEEFDTQKKKILSENK